MPASSCWRSCCCGSPSGCCAASGASYESAAGSAVCRLLALLLAAPARAAGYYVTVAGLVGEPDYEQRFTAPAKDLDKVLKAAGADVHVYTLTGGDATRARLTQVLEQVAREAQARRRLRADAHRPRLVRRRRVQVQSGRPRHVGARSSPRCAIASPPSAS